MKHEKLMQIHPNRASPERILIKGTPEEKK
jgi:hypothetical protein